MALCRFRMRQLQDWIFPKSTGKAFADFEAFLALHQKG
jgi:hypothetical protein